MSEVSDYFDLVFLTALSSAKVKRVEKIRQVEDATSRIGFFRYRVTLINGDLLELTERVEVQAGHITTTKYRHHWQNQAGQLLKRWDNAPHHQPVVSFPHHVHEGSENNVGDHSPVNALDILNLVIQLVKDSP